MPNLRVDVDHGGQQKREGLSRTGGRNSDHVSPEKSHGPALALDGGRSTKALLHNLPQYVLGHGRFFECHGRLGDAFSLDNNPTLVTPRSGFLWASFGHVRVLDVEVLKVERVKTFQTTHGASTRFGDCM